MTVNVIGGGIGGLATAVALQRQRIDAQVYESAAELAPVGKGIWVPTNAMLVLDRLGLGDAVTERGVALDRVEVRDVGGDVLQDVNLGDVRARFGRTTVSVLRCDLQAVLADALQPGTLHLGRRCVGVRAAGPRPAAVFDDGGEAQADLVVGADGLRSIVREAVVPGVPLRYAGQSCYLGVADFCLPDDLARTVWEVWGGPTRFGFSSVGPNRVYWFGPITAPKGAATADVSESDMGALRDRYAEFPGPIPDIVRHTTAADTIRVDLYDFAPIRQWQRDRVVLVGDAAHAMTPNLGQGGAQAIEDAYALALCLASDPDVGAALTRYEQTRRPKASQIVRTAWWFGKLAHLEGRWPRRLRNVALRSTPERVSRRQINALYTLNY